MPVRLNERPVDLDNDAPQPARQIYAHAALRVSAQAHGGLPPRRLHSAFWIAARCSGPEDDPPAAAATMPGRLDLGEGHLVDVDRQVAGGCDGP